MPFTVSQIAERLRGEVLGDGSVELTGFASADHARNSDLTFAEKATYFAAAEQTPAAAIYAHPRLARRRRIHAGTVIGSDGHGKLFDEGRHRKMLQVGNVIIHDDVAIGANTAIARSALGATIIEQGAKISKLVHIAHNV